VRLFIPTNLNPASLICLVAFRVKYFMHINRQRWADNTTKRNGNNTTEDYDMLENKDNPQTNRKEEGKTNTASQIYFKHHIFS
jgi:hypothetical protein